MLRFWRRYTLLGLGLVAALALVLVATTNGGTRSAHAGIISEIDCLTAKGTIICVSLDPEQDTNAVGADHTVTATISLTDLVGTPVKIDLIFAEVVILVFDGPNTGESIINTNPAQAHPVSLNYTGDGGAGTDTIATVVCLFGEGFIGTDAIGKGGGCDLEGFIDFCLEDTTACVEDLTSSKGTCAEVPFFICAVAEKEWVLATPTAEPPPTAEPQPDSTAVPTPPPTAMALADVTLPETGAAAQETSATHAWLAAIIGGIAALSGAAAWIAYQRRRIR